MMAQPHAQGMLTAHGREFKDLTDEDVEESILVAVVVAVGEDVEPRPLFVADDDGECVLKLLAEGHVHHAGVMDSPHMLTSNQRGRGHDPVTVLGRVRSAVAVNIEVFFGSQRGQRCRSAIWPLRV